MQALAIEGEQYGVHVNVLAPAEATQLTEDVLASESLAALKPDLVSPGLLALVGDQAPSRALLHAGAEHFATANVTLTAGRYIGGAADAGEALIDDWHTVSDRQGEIVLAYGFNQAERAASGGGVLRVIYPALDRIKA